MPRRSASSSQTGGPPENKSKQTTTKALSKEARAAAAQRFANEDQEAQQIVTAAAAAAAGLVVPDAPSNTIDFRKSTSNILTQAACVDLSGPKASMLQASGGNLLVRAAVHNLIGETSNARQMTKSIEQACKTHEFALNTSIRTVEDHSKFKGPVHAVHRDGHATMVMRYDTKNTKAESTKPLKQPKHVVFICSEMGVGEKWWKLPKDHKLYYMVVETTQKDRHTSSKAQFVEYDDQQLNFDDIQVFCQRKPIMFASAADGNSMNHKWKVHMLDETRDEKLTQERFHVALVYHIHQIKPFCIPAFDVHLMAQLDVALIKEAVEEIKASLIPLKANPSPWVLENLTNLETGLDQYLEKCEKNPWVQLQKLVQYDYMRKVMHPTSIDWDELFRTIFSGSDSSLSHAINNFRQSVFNVKKLTLKTQASLSLYANMARALAILTMNPLKGFYCDNLTIMKIAYDWIQKQCNNRLPRISCDQVVEKKAVASSSLLAALTDAEPSTALTSSVVSITFGGRRFDFQHYLQYALITEMMPENGGAEGMQRFLQAGLYSEYTFPGAFNMKNYEKLHAIKGIEMMVCCKPDPVKPVVPAPRDMFPAPMSPTASSVATPGPSSVATPGPSSLPSATSLPTHTPVAEMAVFNAFSQKRDEQMRGLLQDKRLENIQTKVNKNLSKQITMSRGTTVSGPNYELGKILTDVVDAEGFWISNEVVVAKPETYQRDAILSQSLLCRHVAGLSITFLSETGAESKIQQLDDESPITEAYIPLTETHVQTINEGLKRLRQRQENANDTKEQKTYKYIAKPQLLVFHANPSSDHYFLRRLISNNWEKGFTSDSIQARSLWSTMTPLNHPDYKAPVDNGLSVALGLTKKAIANMDVLPEQISANAQGIGIYGTGFPVNLFHYGGTVTTSKAMPSSITAQALLASSKLLLKCPESTLLSIGLNNEYPSLLHAHMSDWIHVMLNPDILFTEIIYSDRQIPLCDLVLACIYTVIRYQDELDDEECVIDVNLESLMFFFYPNICTDLRGKFILLLNVLNIYRCLFQWFFIEKIEYHCFRVGNTIIHGTEELLTLELTDDPTEFIDLVKNSIFSRTEPGTLCEFNQHDDFHDTIFTVKQWNTCLLLLGVPASFKEDSSVFIAHFTSSYQVYNAKYTEEMSRRKKGKGARARLLEEGEDDSGSSSSQKRAKC